MTIDRDEFINAGINYIYALDEYPSASVYDQVAKEFDEIIDLNRQEVLNQRADFIGVGDSLDYVNHLIRTEEGNVIAGIRHVGCDKNEPFIYIWPTFKVISIKNILSSIYPYFEVFKPKFISYWVRPDCNDSNEKLIQQRFIGRIAGMDKSDFMLSKAENYYEWYKSEYEIFHKEKPEYKNRITLNSKKLMDDSLNEGLLYFICQGDNKVGLIAGQNEVFLGKKAIYLNEILVGKEYRRQGYANKMLASFINTLTADYFICDIDADNIPSTYTALRSGQTVFSQEIFVEI